MLKNYTTLRAILYPAAMLLLMWLGFLLQLHGFFENCSGAIIPLTPEGLKGVVFSPLLHGSLGHIAGNSVPIAILMFLLFRFYPGISQRVFFLGWLLSGFLVWVFPPLDVFTGTFQYACIIGASGIVYVLAFFLFFAGIFRQDRTLMTVSLVVALYYGSLVWGMLPEELFYRPEGTAHISWQSHLSGAAVGTILAYVYRKKGEKKQKFIWEYPNYYSEKDDRLWQRYKAEHPEDFLELPHKKREEIWEHLEDIRRR